MFIFCFFFFFQAEDGIRDGTVTGVQTCALPILRPTTMPSGSWTRWGNGLAGSASRSEERRVGKGVDLGGRRIIKKKKKNRKIIKSFKIEKRLYINTYTINFNSQ